MTMLETDSEQCMQRIVRETSDLQVVLRSKIAATERLIDQTMQAIQQTLAITKSETLPE